MQMQIGEHQKRRDGRSSLSPVHLMWSGGWGGAHTSRWSPHQINGSHETSRRQGRARIQTWERVLFCFVMLFLFLFLIVGNRQASSSMFSVMPTWTLRLIFFPFSFERCFYFCFLVFRLLLCAFLIDNFRLNCLYLKWSRNYKKLSIFS